MSPEPAWQRSSACAGGGNNCLEVRAMAALVLLRESDAPGIVIATPRAQMAALITRIKADGRR
ncbi:DUF397 domain-containing protein [Streptomyces abikoensis]|uniref:DUF397 domain-containing protein n=1 Tax=Streptomyces abikoensis TaxID=97398 RepID=UPI003686D7C7